MVYFIRSFLKETYKHVNQLKSLKVAKRVNIANKTCFHIYHFKYLKSNRLDLNYKLAYIRKAFPMRNRGNEKCSSTNDQNDVCD